MKTNLKIILGLSLLSFTTAGAMALEGEKNGAEESFNSAITGGMDLPGENVTVPVVQTNSIINSILDYFDLNKRVKNTKFDTLEMLFNAGRRPIAEEVTGWFSGVTFSKADPNTPWAAMLTGKTILTGGESTGPLFQKEEIIFNIYFSNDLHEYDNLSQDEIERYKRDNRFFAKVNDREMVFTINEGSMGVLNYQVRKYDEYLIVKYSSPGMNEYVSYSYFFKNITPGSKNHVSGEYLYSDGRTKKQRKNTFSVRDMSLGTSMSEAHY